MSETKLRGFASLSPERRKEVASMGGKAVKAENRTFSRDPMAARIAGQKGGLSVDPAKRAFSQDRALASAAGRKGAMAQKDGA
jgi:general stress protein YciG